MSEWREVELRELCDSVQYGVTASALPDRRTGTRFLRITDIVPPSIDWDSVPDCDVPAEVVERFRVRSGDIVVARTGATVGYAKQLRDPPPAVFASYLVRFQIGQGTDPAYVGHVVQSDAYKRYVRANAGGAAQPNANAGTLGAFRVPLPDLNTQRRIAAVLSAFDELIELNQRRIELLEDLARSLYREWFVRFRFPGHEDVEFAGSEIGMIPAEWEVGRLDDHLVLARGFDLPTGQRSDGHVPVVSASGISGSHSEAKVKGPGVITGRSGTIGHVAYVRDDFWPLNTTLWVKDFRVATPRTAYLLLESIGLESHATGAAVPTLNRNHIHGLPTVKPPRSVVEEFDQRAAPVFELTFALRDRNESLVATRDLLLPRLVIGRLDISDVDLGDLVTAETA